MSAVRRTGPDLTDGYAWHRSANGHWYTTDQFDGHNIRVERYLMQKHLGRPLRHDEWVVLKDGDPDNLDLDNIEVLTPTERMARRDGRHWTRDDVIAALGEYFDQHGDLPASIVVGGDFGPCLATILDRLDADSWLDAMAIADAELGVGGRYGAA